MTEQLRAQTARTAPRGKSYIKADDLTKLGIGLLVAAGLSKADARIVAECLVEADLRGVETHGMVRLVHYINRIGLGLIKAKPNMVLNQVTPVALHIDADDAFGFVASRRAMDEAIRMAAEYGIGMVSVRGSTHFGMAASYVIQANEAGYMSMVFTNASKSMPPWGGRDPILGTSPFAAGAPAGKQPPFVLDMSVAVAARGKIRLAALRGQQIPEGWGLDRDGKPTTSPQAVLDDGVVLPVGGPKGSAIAMMMDIFSGVFSGSKFAGEVTNHTLDYENKQDVGHFFLAIKPGLFVTEEGFRDRMDELVYKLKSSQRIDGVDEIFISGEPETRKQEARMMEGIQLPDAELETLFKAAREASVAIPDVSRQPFAEVK
jgi:LDH2 family malate/lactate/ureidoglycolate dehydrogenase